MNEPYSPKHKAGQYSTTQPQRANIKGIHLKVHKIYRTEQNASSLYILCKWKKPKTKNMTPTKELSLKARNLIKPLVPDSSHKVQYDLTGLAFWSRDEPDITMVSKVNTRPITCFVFTFATWMECKRTAQQCTIKRSVKKLEVSNSYKCWNMTRKTKQMCRLSIWL